MAEKLRLYQYAVLLHKTEVKDGKKEVVSSEIIIKPEYMLAKTDREVAFKITRLIPEEHVSDPENVEIIIKNF